MRDLDCRWIICDQHFKYNTCLLKKAFADCLYDKFEEMKLKHPWYALAINDSCCHCSSCGFENARNDDGIKNNSAEADEEEAERKAKELVASLTTIELREIYIRLSISKIEFQKKKIRRLEDELSQNEKEVQTLQDMQRDASQNLRKISHWNLFEEDQNPLEANCEHV